MNSVETAPPTFWVGRVGRAQLGELLLELLEPAQPPVEVGVGERRVVEHVVAPARVLDLLGELLVLARAPRRGADSGSVPTALMAAILPGATDSQPRRGPHRRRRRRTDRSGPEETDLARE